MDRRSYLSVAVGGLVGGAGCGFPTRDALSRRVSVAERSTNELDVSVVTVDPTATGAHPPRLQVTWSNPGPGPFEVNIDGKEPEPRPSDGDGARLVLVPVGYGVTPEPEADGCWALEDPLPVPGDQDRTTLAVGESIRAEYEVWTGSETDGCLPPGTYQFGPPGPNPPWRITLELTQ